MVPPSSRARACTEAVRRAGTSAPSFFRFLIHRDDDRDKDLYPAVDDRQRNEIKVYDRSREESWALDGDTTRYHWYLFIPSGFPVTRRFTFMQIKASGGDDAQPVFTLSGALVAGQAELQFRHAAATGVPDEYLARVPLDRATGRWLD